MTAGNASGINDGAAALVVAAPAAAAARGLRPIARVLSYAVVGVEPIVMGLGPIGAVRLALERAGLAVSDIDLFELNEAFAAQALAVSRELGLDGAQVNVHGGAIALGHPIGASGARVLTTLIYALRARGGGRGVASSVHRRRHGHRDGDRGRRPRLGSRLPAQRTAFEACAGAVHSLELRGPVLRPRGHGESACGPAPAADCVSRAGPATDWDVDQHRHRGDGARILVFRDYHLETGQTANGPDRRDRRRGPHRWPRRRQRGGGRGRRAGRARGGHRRRAVAVGGDAIVDPKARIYGERQRDRGAIPRHRRRLGSDAATRVRGPSPWPRRSPLLVVFFVVAACLALIAPAWVRQISCARR